MTSYCVHFGTFGMISSDATFLAKPLAEGPAAFLLSWAGDDGIFFMLATHAWYANEPSERSPFTGHISTGQPTRNDMTIAGCVNSGRRGRVVHFIGEVFRAHHPHLVTTHDLLLFRPSVRRPLTQHLFFTKRDIWCYTVGTGTLILPIYDIVSLHGPLAYPRERGNADTRKGSSCELLTLNPFTEFTACRKRQVFSGKILLGSKPRNLFGGPLQFLAGSGSGHPKMCAPLQSSCSSRSPTCGAISGKRSQ